MVETIFFGIVLKRNRLRWFGHACEEKEKGLGEEMHVYGGGGCKVKRKAKKNLFWSGKENIKARIGPMCLSSDDALDRGLEEEDCEDTC